MVLCCIYLILQRIDEQIAISSQVSARHLTDTSFMLCNG